MLLNCTRSCSLNALMICCLLKQIGHTWQCAKDDDKAKSTCTHVMRISCMRKKFWDKGKWNIYKILIASLHSFTQNQTKKLCNSKKHRRERAKDREEKRYQDWRDNSLWSMNFMMANPFLQSYSLPYFFLLLSPWTLN